MISETWNFLSERHRIISICPWDERYQANYQAWCCDMDNLMLAQLSKTWYGLCDVVYTWRSDFFTLMSRCVEHIALWTNTTHERFMRNTDWLLVNVLCHAEGQLALSVDFRSRQHVSFVASCCAIDFEVSMMLKLFIKDDWMLTRLPKGENNAHTFSDRVRHAVDCIKPSVTPKTSSALLERHNQTLKIMNTIDGW